MSDTLHPAASHTMPSFITAPGETDVLMVVTGVFLLLSVVGFGLIFLRLHTLPERLAHKSKKVQFEIVAILGLIALFTHMHIFWIAGLLLAFIDFPDFGGFLGRIAGSVEKMAGIKPRDSTEEASPDMADAQHAGEAAKKEGSDAAPVKAKHASSGQKGKIHA